MSQVVRSPSPYVPTSPNYSPNTRAQMRIMAMQPTPPSPQYNFSPRTPSPAPVVVKPINHNWVEGEKTEKVHKVLNFDPDETETDEE